MESNHTKINLKDGKLESSWGKSKNTDYSEKYRQLQTIFNPFPEKVCITDQNYFYRPNCHHWDSNFEENDSKLTISVI